MSGERFAMCVVLSCLCCKRAAHGGWDGRGKDSCPRQIDILSVERVW